MDKRTSFIYNSLCKSLEETIDGMLTTGTSVCYVTILWFLLLFRIMIVVLLGRC